MKKFLATPLVLPLAVLLALPAAAQQTGALIGGGGLTIFKTLPLDSGAVVMGQGAAADPVAHALSGDCTMTAGGVVTCLKSNGSTLGSAAFANTGASGTAVPLLNSPATISAAWVFGAHQVAGSASPALSSCGGGSPTIVGDDSFGEVTMGTSATGCVITFNAAYTGAPLCTVSWQATPLASQSYAVTNTAITLTQTSTSGNKVNYACRARTGG